MTRQPRILVIDDDPLFQLRIEKVLEDDFEVLAAMNGVDGMAQAKAELPDVVMLDIQMPVMDGIQTLKEFRSDPQLRTMPVLIISSGSDREVVIQARDLGADDYVIKSDALQGILPPRLKALLARKENHEARDEGGDESELEPQLLPESVSAATLDEISQNFEDGF